MFNLQPSRPRDETVTVLPIKRIKLQNIRRVFVLEAYTNTRLHEYRTKNGRHLKRRAFAFEIRRRTAIRVETKTSWFTAITQLECVSMYGR